MLWVENENLLVELFSEISALFSMTIHVVNQNKMVSYTNHIKIEFSYSETLDGNNFKRNYLGSAIPKDKILDSILFDKTHQAQKTLLSWQQNKVKTPEIRDEYINSFIYEFELASNFHRRGDSYRCYFCYNLALNTAVRLYHLLHVDSRFNFLPKYISYDMNASEMSSHLSQLNGVLNLQKLNRKKRLLLDFLYEVIAVEKSDLSEIKKTCEYFYERDKLWNFRDIAQNVSGIKKQKIFRSAMLAIYSDEEIIEVCQKNNIETIIDLRATKELKEATYSDRILEEINHVHIPFDPWNQPQEFINSKHHTGTNVEIAYKFFIYGCKNQIKKIFNILASTKNATLVHCVAGKDRTGIIVSLLQLLVGISQEDIYIDYLASEANTHKDKINIVFKCVEQAGGIDKYLMSCGISTATIDLLKKKYYVEN